MKTKLKVNLFFKRKKQSVSLEIFDSYFQKKLSCKQLFYNYAAIEFLAQTKCELVN